MTVHIPSDEEIQNMDVLLQDFEQLNVRAMLHIKKVQSWNDADFLARFGGVKPELIRRYMRPSYDRTRPIHFMAAFSWVTNVPATSFYLGSKIMESWRGMDEGAVNALVCIGSMPFDQFDILMNCLFLYLSDEGKEKVEALKSQFLSDVDASGEMERANAAPAVVDLDLFAESYYRSIAIITKNFRVENNITMGDMSRVLGLSRYQYAELENPNNPMTFSLTVGARIRLGFRLNSHVSFTSEMTHYPEFHVFRLLQERREHLLLESLRYVTEKSKPYVIEIIKGVSNAYIGKK